jgi:hypothetical protein
MFPRFFGLNRWQEVKVCPNSKSMTSRVLGPKLSRGFGRTCPSPDLRGSSDRLRLHFLLRRPAGDPCLNSNNVLKTFFSMRGFYPFVSQKGVTCHPSASVIGLRFRYAGATLCLPKERWADLCGSIPTCFCYSIIVLFVLTDRNSKSCK